MAIYHLCVKPVQRSRGRSAIAAAAYRSGSRLRDKRTGESHDYRRKRGVIYQAILTPDGSQIDRQALWNMAESAEKRRDGTTAREIEVALPHELAPHDQFTLAKLFATDLVKRYGVAADLCIHAPSNKGDQRNAHAHILLTTRTYSAGHLDKKSELELSDTDRRKRGLCSRRAELQALRYGWERMANEALLAAGIDSRIDCRSLAAQGKEQVAGIHLGPAASAMERRGVSASRGYLTWYSQSINRLNKEISEQLKSLTPATAASTFPYSDTDYTAGYRP